jgi:predicted metal-dependent HD superfamily phosphohydrolase
MNMPTFQQWQNPWQALGFAAPEQIYNQLIASYNQAHRHYHNNQHLAEVLSKFTELEDLSRNPAEIQLALWFHDAVYEPLLHDNEQRSAKWSQSCLLAEGIAPVIAERVYDLIMVTQHTSQPKSIDAEIVVDCDLAILAAAPERFMEYEKQIRLEYAHVTDKVFQEKRADILASFLKLSTIFNTPRFIEHYEADARRNLTSALENLSV